MVDYSFYLDNYLGSLIPEKSFAAAVNQAKAVLERLKRQYRVRSSGQESEAMAICAMAETLYLAEQHRGGIRSASAGSLSVQYEDAQESRKALWRELYEQAGTYLEIYRGTVIG